MPATVETLWDANYGMPARWRKSRPFNFFLSVRRSSAFVDGVFSSAFFLIVCAFFSTDFKMSRRDDDDSMDNEDDIEEGKKL